MLNLRIQRLYLRQILLFLYVSAGIYMAINWLPSVISWFLPFILSFGLVHLTRPAVIFMQVNWGLPRRLASIVCLALVLGSFITLLWLIISHAFSELVSLAHNSGHYLAQIQEYISYIEGLSPMFSGLTGYVNSAVSNLSVYLITAAANVAFSMPDKMIFILVFFVSLFFFAADYEDIVSKVKTKIPFAKKQRILQIKGFAASAVTRYLRGMLIIMTIDYAILLCGLLILQIDYAFLLSLIIAFVDILPLVGTGAVLIPWSVVLLLEGNTAFAIKLLTLWLIVTVLRQLIEPKIMSKALGLYPIITLLSVYVGYKAIGYAGILLCPIASLVALHIYYSASKQ